MCDQTEKYSYSLRATVADDDTHFDRYGLTQCRWACVEAKQMRQAFILETTESKIVGLPGDYVVKTKDGFIFILPGPVFTDLFEPLSRGEHS
jgi:hypothetical protein